MNNSKYICKDCGKEMTQQELNENKYIYKTHQCIKCYKEDDNKKYEGSFIYTFKCSDTNTIFYVGQTDNYRQRLSAHIHTHTDVHIEYDDILNGKVKIRLFDVDSIAKNEFDRKILENILIDKLLEMGIKLKNINKNNIDLDKITTKDLFEKYSDKIISLSKSSMLQEYSPFVRQKIVIENGKTSIKFLSSTIEFK
jgi:hypothetical protein